MGISRHGIDRPQQCRAVDGVSVDAWESEGYWANVRMSNTEPLVRLNLEGRTAEIMEARRDEFLAEIRR